MISAHTCTAQIWTLVAGTYQPGPILDVKAASITLDEAWSPFVQGDLTVVLPDAATEALLDPRGMSRLVIDLEQQFGESAPISDLSAAWAGLTLANLTTLYAGDTLADITAEHYQPYNPGPTLPPTSRRFDLMIRAVAPRRAHGELAITVSSDEARLQDYRLLEPGTYLPGGTSVRALTRLALARINATLLEEFPAADGVVLAAATEWQPGVTAEKWLEPMLQTNGLRLFCTERREWRLVTTRSALVPLSTSPPSPAPLASTSDSITRDGEWYDAVVVVYRWVDSGGIPRVQADTASVAGWSRALLLEHDTPYPGPGAAATALQYSVSRAREITYVAISDYNAYPSELLDIALPGIAENTAIITRVRWAFPADEMTLSIRDLSISGLG